jgi:chromate transport protein ChrA
VACFLQAFICPSEWLLLYLQTLSSKNSCPDMKKEFGKWLMDIAKYMVTALLLSSVFGNMENLWSTISVIIASAITLSVGLWFLKDKKEE